MDLLLLYICIPGGICCVIIAVCVCMRCFAVSRRTPSKTAYHIKYIPDRVERVIEVINFKSPLSKRERRKLRLKQLSQYRAALKVTPVTVEEAKDPEQSNSPENDIEEGLGEEDEEIEGEEGDDDDDDISLPPPMMKRSASSSFFGTSFMSMLSFTSNSSRGLLSKQSSMKKRSTMKRQPSSSGTSTKSKRHVSQERIDRTEARKALIRSSMQNIVEIIPEITLDMEENVISILDVKKLQEQKAETIIERRRRIREEIRSEAIARGEMDVVELNSGPPADKLPIGYKMIEFIPNLSPEFLIYKRVLYKWEIAKKPQGWFLGTIVSSSKVPAANFNIKYDRAETGTVFVDGVHAVLLSMEGLQAYGRKWVVLEWTDDQRH